MKKFNKTIQAKFDQMCQTGKLFRVALTGAQIWDLYLKSFTREDDPVFRDPNSSVHNCNHCNNFVRRYGNIVSIDENFNITTMFDVEADEEFKNTAVVLSKAIRESQVTEVFFETFNELNSLPYEQVSKLTVFFKLGVDVNKKRYTKEEAEKYGVVQPDEVRTFNHMHLLLPKMFVDNTGKSVETLMGEFRDAKNVFQRAMEEISLDTLHLVRDLVNQGSLLDGQTHLYKVEQFIPLKTEYDQLSAAQRENWCWVKSYKLPIAKFKNELIGVLCSELSEGMELNAACQAWNKRVDPANYMKVTAPITAKQIAEAKEFVETNGYTESFDRRLATLDDIKATEILHVNVGKGEIKSVSMFDNVKSTSSRHKRNEFEGVEEVDIVKFMTDILPGCTSIEAFLSNAHAGNLVTLTTAKNTDSKPIFKWPNNYSWTFNGNLAGKSQIKQAVKDAGGSVDGALNFRLAWNDDKQNDESDLDAWAQEPNGKQIGYNTGFRRDVTGRRSLFSGQLDVDNRHPNGKIAVENITWNDITKMKDGVYRLWVHQFSARNSQGFKAEIEFDGQTYCYEYNKPVRDIIAVAEVTLTNGTFTIKHLIPESSVSTKEIYGLESNNFHKVNLVCYSPNWWNYAPGTGRGNKHYFFMLDNCKAPTSIRGFHNENLIPELADHRRVLEVLGVTNMIPSTDKQLSGLGFNATVRDELILKLQGTHKRIIKIKF